MAAAQQSTLPAPPDDGVSALRWSPTSNHLVAASWDNSVRCWQVGERLDGTPVALTSTHTGPVLDACWAPDGRAVLSASADGTALLWDLESSATRQVAAHEGPIRSLFVDPASSMLVTGGMDATLRFWDTRQASHVGTIALPGRVRCMSSLAALAVVVCSPATAAAQSTVCVLNLSTPDRIFRTFDPTLPYPVISVAALGGDKQAFVLGTIEGRAGVHFAESSVDTSSTFSFKCHRAKPTVYAVNDLALNAAFGTFASAGQDGSVATWDHVGRARLAEVIQEKQPAAAIAFNATGELLATALCYDWGRGHEYHKRDQKPIVRVRRMREVEVKPTPTAPKRK